MSFPLQAPLRRLYRFQAWALAALSWLGLSSFISAGYQGSYPRLKLLGRQSSWQRRSNIDSPISYGTLCSPSAAQAHNHWPSCLHESTRTMRKCERQQVELVYALCLLFCRVFISVVLIALLPSISSTPMLTHTSDPGELDSFNVDTLHNKTGTFLPVESNTILTVLTVLQRLRDEVC